MLRYTLAWSVVDPSTLNLDPDPEFWPNLDRDPDPGLTYLYTSLHVVQYLYRYIYSHAVVNFVILFRLLCTEIVHLAELC